MNLTAEGANIILGLLGMVLSAGIAYGMAKATLAGYSKDIEDNERAIKTLQERMAQMPNLSDCDRSHANICNKIEAQSAAYKRESGRIEGRVDYQAEHFSAVMKEINALSTSMATVNSKIDTVIQYQQKDIDELKTVVKDHEKQLHELKKGVRPA